MSAVRPKWWTRKRKAMANRALLWMVWAWAVVGWVVIVPLAILRAGY